MKTIAKTIAKHVLYISGFYRLCRRRASSAKKRLLILMYHDVLEDEDADTGQLIDDESPTRSQFDAHLREIVRNYRVVSVGQAVDEIQSENGLETDSVAVTFDDGYASVYSIAYPLLRKYSVPATVFLLTGWIESDTVFWWQHVRDMVKKSSFTGVKSAELGEIVGFHTGSFKSGLDIDMEFRRQLARRLQSQLKTIPDDDRLSRLEKLQDLLFPDGDYVFGGEKALSWDQIRVMADNGMDFQAHTSSHIDMRFADLETIERDIIQSKKDIESQIGRLVNGFAFPYGKDLDSYVAAENILRKNGFRYACTAYPGINSDASNLYALRRGCLPPTASNAIINHDLCYRLVRTND
ncbi:MAG: polysaccharide deacetylase family protein [Candidatus Latescibacterota bacterium]|nr:MAG: polysaccharide deacetylase family protein [Candidatus Latescibacterota bacterium]